MAARARVTRISRAPPRAQLRFVILLRRRGLESAGSSHIHQFSSDHERVHAQLFCSTVVCAKRDRTKVLSKTVQCAVRL